MSQSEEALVSFGYTSFRDPSLCRTITLKPTLNSRRAANRFTRVTQSAAMDERHGNGIAGWRSNLRASPDDAGRDRVQSEDAATAGENYWETEIQILRRLHFFCCL